MVTFGHLHLYFKHFVSSMFNCCNFLLFYTPSSPLVLFLSICCCLLFVVCLDLFLSRDITFSLAPCLVAVPSARCSSLPRLEAHHLLHETRRKKQTPYSHTRSPNHESIQQVLQTGEHCRRCCNHIRSAGPYKRHLALTATIYASFVGQCHEDIEGSLNEIM